MHPTMYLVGYVIEKRIVFTSSKTSAILIRVSSGKSLKVGTSFKKAKGERKKIVNKLTKNVNKKNHTSMFSLANKSSSQHNGLEALSFNGP